MCVSAVGTNCAEPTAKLSVRNSKDEKIQNIKQPKQNTKTNKKKGAKAGPVNEMEDIKAAYSAVRGFCS